MKLEDNQINASQKEISRLKSLGESWMEIALSDDVKIKKRQWKALRDLHPERPMILFETFGLDSYIDQSELLCSDPVLRNLEKNLLHHLKHYKEIQDDMVFDPYIRLGYDIAMSDYGIPIIEQHVKDSIAYTSNFPIKTPDDIERLKPRTFFANKDNSQKMYETISEIMGDQIPVKLANIDPLSCFMSADTLKGFYPFCGLNTILMMKDLYELIGNDNLHLWVYDHPETLHRLLRYLTDDRKRFFKWLLDEKMLKPNTDAQHAGPFSYGYVSGLPDADLDVSSLKDCWIWIESQETMTISPDMFEEIFLPYLAEIANLFGLTYYGCCEPLHDRIDRILKKIPNIRTVSVSAWSNIEKMADILGKNYVYCRKPNPSIISGKQPDWEAAKNDIKETWKHTKDKNLEITIRDIYDIGHDNLRGRQWVEMTKQIIGI